MQDCCANTVRTNAMHRKGMAEFKDTDLEGRLDSIDRNILLIYYA